MRVKLTTLSDNKFKLLITADQDLIDNTKTKVLRHMAAKHVKLPGFRAGKAPLNLVEKHSDPTQLQQEFLDEAVNRLYAQAIKAENLRPIANPKVSLKKFVPFTEFEFEAEVEAIGNIKLANYKNIKMPRTKVTIVDKDVTEVLSGLRQRLAERKVVERPAKNGDEVIIDFTGKDSQGKRIAGADGKEQPIIIGSNTFIPGFETNLIGLKADQEKTFSLTFPKDYTVNALQSKKVSFNVVIKKINEIIEPKLDDSFAAKAGPFKTLAELKADIKKQIGIERQEQADREYENQLVSKIAKASEVSVPGVLVDEQVDRNEQAERQNLVYRGQTWQEHLEDEGVTEAQHRERNRPDAEASVKAGLVLSEIAQQEGLVVTPEEFEIRLQILKGQYTDKAMQTELDKPENRRDIENRLLTEKTLAKLVQYSQK